MKKNVIEYIICSIFFLLLAGAFILISIGVNCEGATQNLLIGLGTGSATSFLVSFVFYINEKLTAKSRCIKNRESFMIDFKMLLYRTIETIDFAIIPDGDYSLQEYIKIQHRWYHDYFKRMDVDSGTEEETKQRLQDLKDYLDSEEHFFEATFQFNDRWKQSGFNDSQFSKLETIYSLFKTTLISVKNERIERAFLDFSSLLELFKNIMDYIEELNSFKLIKITIANKETFIVYNEFEKHEPLFKFCREFSEIRHKNNIEKYSETNTNE